MARSARPARAARGVPDGIEEAAERCPRCGSGDLFVVRMARPGGDAATGAYCAGVYDRDRRRFVRRSCGYAGTDPAAAAPAAAGLLMET
jgi:hypothetical protein